MDILAALEEMAACGGTGDDYCAANVDRWTTLFNITYNQAEKAIESHLSNLSRITFTNEQWSILSEKPDARGHDKQSYSYYLSLIKRTKPTKAPTSQRKFRGKLHEYLFKLEVPLNTAEKVRDAMNLPNVPRTVVDTTGENEFVVIDATTRAAIEDLLHPTQLTFAPLKRPAEKELSSRSIAPTLGVEATLPQHRIGDTTYAKPRQNEYPVPYFFYGTLAEPERLTAMLALPNAPVITPAEIVRGKLRTWGGKYHALVDGGEKDEVPGWMYVVECEEHEDLLREYEGDSYEVVRCDIVAKGWVGGKEAFKGLTFRFCGDEERKSG